MDAKKFNNLINKLSISSNAYSKIYKFYNPIIRLHLWIKFRNKQLSEDIAHDFFVKLKQMDFPKYIDNPTAWIFTCCDNAAKNKIIKESREILVANDTAQQLSKNSTDEQELYGEYTEKLNLLDDETKNIIIKRVFEEYTLKEISEDMNINYNTVRQMYSRGIKKLKKL